MNTTYQSPLLTDRVNLSWEELKEASACGRTRVAPVIPKSPARIDSGATCGLSEADRAKLVAQIADAVAPVVQERIQAQVSIIVDMALKNAAAKIRGDLDHAIATTVASVVRQTINQKIQP